MLKKHKESTVLCQSMIKNPLKIGRMLKSVHNFKFICLRHMVEVINTIIIISTNRLVFKNFWRRR